MYRFYISTKKEFTILLADKVGLALMFAMPLLLVFIITSIQDSAFKMMDNSQITMLIANNDEGELGEKLSNQLAASGMFEISNNTMDSIELKKAIDNKDALTGLYIPKDFTFQLTNLAQNIGNGLLKDMGLEEKEVEEISIPSIIFVHDPVLQKNYCESISGMVYAHMGSIESSRMIQTIYSQMGFPEVPARMQQNITQNHILIKTSSISKNAEKPQPNAAQHNVPAWTIFAMFFMVVSLGTNIVKERESGSFMRIKTMPSSFLIVLISKQIVYISVAIIQVLLMFCVGAYIFPTIGLPQLHLPSNLLGMFAITVFSGLTAVSYSIFIGAIAKTEQQANGLGAISIIILASLGGVWVPTFVMPNYMQILSNFSPLHWCIEGFYTLFLKDGNWNELVKIISILIGFSFVFQLLTYIKFKINRIL